MLYDEKLTRLKAACIRARLDFDAVIQECRDGHSQFFENEDCAAIGAFVISGTFKTYYVTLCGGTWEGFAALKPAIEQFAMAHNCDYIRTVGRPGFQESGKDKVIGPEYRVVGIMYEKDLTHGRP